MFFFGIIYGSFSPGEHKYCHISHKTPSRSRGMWSPTGKPVVFCGGDKDTYLRQEPQADRLSNSQFLIWILRNRSPFLPPAICRPIPLSLSLLPSDTPGGMVSKNVFFLKPCAILTNFRAPKRASRSLTETTP